MEMGNRSHFLFLNWAYGTLVAFDISSATSQLYPKTAAGVATKECKHKENVPKCRRVLGAGG